jgi:hypothetical protein
MLFRFNISISFLLIVAALLPQNLFAKALACAPLFDQIVKEEEWNRLPEHEKQRLRAESMFSKDQSFAIERRIKRITSGTRKDADPNIDAADIRIDSADPSLVMPITYPNGVTKYRINFSGLRYVEANSPREFYRGGIFKVQQSRGFYADGTEMVGAYHNASWPWDVVIYKNDFGQNIALGGVMMQSKKGELPNVATDNVTRSRWWGEVKHVEVRPGVYEEHIIWQGPVHDFNYQKQVGWNHHGYGGTLLTRYNPKTKQHELVKLPNGNYLLFYERVLESKTLPNGEVIPWITTLFVREMDRSMTRTVGEEIMVTDIISPKTKKPFKATERVLGLGGYLAEGGNVLVELQRRYALKAFSGNDYVGQYGIYLDYLRTGQNLKSKFLPVMDHNGELVDFAKTLNLRKLLNATWLGRPQMEYDPDGKLWLRFHYVDISTIPKGAPIEGWPTADQFLHFGRVTAQVPIKITYENNIPKIELDIDPQFQYLFR